MLWISLRCDLTTFLSDPIHLHYASIFGYNCNCYASQSAWEKCWHIDHVLCQAHNSPLQPPVPGTTRPTWTQQGQGRKVKRWLVREEMRGHSSGEKRSWSQLSESWLGVSLTPATLRILGKRGKLLIMSNEVELACMRQLLLMCENAGGQWNYVWCLFMRVP